MIYDMTKLAFLAKFLCLLKTDTSKSFIPSLNGDDYNLNDGHLLRK